MSFTIENANGLILVLQPFYHQITCRLIIHLRSLCTSLYQTSNKYITFGWKSSFPMFSFVHRSLTNQNASVRAPMRVRAACVLSEALWQALMIVKTTKEVQKRGIRWGPTSPPVWKVCNRTEQNRTKWWWLFTVEVLGYTEPHYISGGVNDVCASVACYSSSRKATCWPII